MTSHPDSRALLLDNNNNKTMRGESVDRIKLVRRIKEKHISDIKKNVAEQNLG